MRRPSIVKTVMVFVPRSLPSTVSWYEIDAAELDLFRLVVDQRGICSVLVARIGFRWNDVRLIGRIHGHFDEVVVGVLVRNEDKLRLHGMRSGGIADSWMHRVDQDAGSEDGGDDENRRDRAR